MLNYQRVFDVICFNEGCKPMKSGCFPRMIFENISEMVKLPRSQTKPAASEATWDAFVLRPQKKTLL